MSKIEEVAKAIYDTWAQKKGAEADWQLVCDAAATTSEKEFPALHETYNLAFKEARAAIEAMREPTDAMVDAGQWQIDPVSLYQSFINAALLEQQP